MKPLASIQCFLVWLCVCPFIEATSKWQQLAYKTFAVSLILTLVSFFISSLWCFWTFVSINLEEALYALYQIVGLSCLLYLLIVVYLSRSKINAIFIQLSDIYRASNNCLVNWNEQQIFLVISFKFTDSDEDSFRFLAQANTTSEWVWRFFIEIAKILTIWLAVVSVASVFFCWFMHGQFDPKLVYHPYRVVWVDKSKCLNVNIWMNTHGIIV